MIKIDWNKIKKTGNKATDLCLSIVYKYRIIQPKPLKCIYLSPIMYDQMRLFWSKKSGDCQNILTLDGVEIYRGSFVKWEYECKFWPEKRTELDDLTFAPRVEEVKQESIPELDQMYKDGLIKTKIEKE